MRTIRCSICHRERDSNGAWCTDCRAWYRDFAYRFDLVCSVLWPRQNKTRTQLNHYAPKIPTRNHNQSLQNAADALLVDWFLSDECRDWIAARAGGWKRG
jgi:hypothetical protein